MIPTFTYSPPYTISGQEGAAMGLARNTLEELGIETAGPVFHSMAEDTLTWHQRGGTAPDYLQEIALWDATGKCIFRGNVTACDPEWDGSGITGYDVTVSGPWWWLEQAQLTSLVSDSAGEESERPEFVFPSQDLAISLRSLLDRMQGLGVPLQCGDIAPTFPVPQMTFQSSTAASALRDMLGWIQDAMTSIDYSSGTPKINIFRRSSAGIFIAIPGYNIATGEALKIRAKRQIRPESVTVQSMELDASGGVIYKTRTAGASADETSVIGRQILAVSGPGTPGFRPRDVELAQIKTLTLSTSLQALFYLKNSALNNLGSGWNIMTGTWSWRVYNGTGFTVYWINPREAVVINDGEIAVGALFPYALVGEDLPDWIGEAGISVQKVKHMVRFITTSTNADVLALATMHGDGAAFADLEIEYYALNVSYPALATIIRPRDKFLVTPVSGLEENLLASQSWTPYEGEIPILPGAPEIPLPGRTFSIRGAVPEWAGMAAMVSATRIDLVNGSARVTLGSSNRSAATALLDRFSRPASGRVLNL